VRRLTGKIWSAPVFSELWERAERGGWGPGCADGPPPRRSTPSHSSEKIGALQNGSPRVTLAWPQAADSALDGRLPEAGRLV